MKQSLLFLPETALLGVPLEERSAAIGADPRPNPAGSSRIDALLRIKLPHLMGKGEKVVVSGRWLIRSIGHGIQSVSDLEN